MKRLNCLSCYYIVYIGYIIAGISVCNAERGISFRTRGERMNNLSGGENIASYVPKVHGVEVLKEKERMDRIVLFNRLGELVSITLGAIEAHSKLYDEYADGELGAVIGRLELNVTQLKHIMRVE